MVLNGEKILMAGNNRFIRVENSFDKIHAHMFKRNVTK